MMIDELVETDEYTKAQLKNRTLDELEELHGEAFDYGQD